MKTDNMHRLYTICFCTQAYAVMCVILCMVFSMEIVMSVYLHLGGRCLTDGIVISHKIQVDVGTHCPVFYLGGVDCSIDFDQMREPWIGNTCVGLNPKP